MKSSIVKPSDPIAVLAVFHNYKTVYASNGIHERAAMLLFLHFMEDLDKATFSYRMSPIESNTAHKEGILTTYCSVVNYPLKTYATDDFIAGAESEITNFKQSENMSALHHSEKLWDKALRCGKVYEDARLKGAFTEALHHSIYFSMRTYGNTNKGATL